MVDVTTLTLIATFVQTIVITLTLLVFIFQFRSQEKAIKEASYQNLMGRYNDYVMSGTTADDRLISRMFEPEPGRNFSVDEMAGMRRLMIAYGILEEAYELYKKKWIDKETWDQWGTWLEAMCRYPQFALLHSRVTGMFDKDFQSYVSRLLERSKISAEEKGNPERENTD